MVSELQLQSYAVESIIRGYHVYREVWGTAIGQCPPCQGERGNIHDPYAVASEQRHVVQRSSPIASDLWVRFVLGKRSGCRIFAENAFANRQRNANFAKVSPAKETRCTVS